MSVSDGAGTSSKPPLVSGESACGIAPGYYFDAQSAPTLIDLCPASCALLAQANMKIELLLDCP